MGKVSFQDLIQSEKPVLVDFSAEWCGPCKMMAPVLRELKALVAHRATIIKIDVDRNPEISAVYQIRGVPTLMIFQKGEIKWRQSGVLTAHQLKQTLSRFYQPAVV